MFALRVGGGERVTPQVGRIEMVTLRAGGGQRVTPLAGGIRTIASRAGGGLSPGRKNREKLVGHSPGERKKDDHSWGERFEQS